MTGFQRNRGSGLIQYESYSIVVNWAIASNQPVYEAIDVTGESVYQFFAYRQSTLSPRDRQKLRRKLSRIQIYMINGDMKLATFR